MRVPGPPPIPPRPTIEARGFTREQIRASVDHARSFSPAQRKGTHVDAEGNIRHGNGKIAKLEGVAHNTRVNWNQNHQLILWMDISGMRQADIAAQVRYHIGSVRAIMGSPLYQQRKAATVEQLTAGGIGTILDKIRVDAPKNLEFLISTRESRLEETKDRIAAARVLTRETDRVWPRTTKHVEDRTVRIMIDGQKLARLTSALVEVGATIVDADVIEEFANAPAESAAPLAEKSIEQLMDECRAAERE